MAENYKDTIKRKKTEAKRLMTKEQIKACNIAIHSASAAAAAGGVIPIPVVDAVPISAAQVTMVIALGKVFNQSITGSVAKGLISAAASTFVGRNLVKMIPVVGWGVSAAVAAGVTEAIGWSIAVDFANVYQNKADKDFKELFSEAIKNAKTVSVDELDDENEENSSAE